MSSVTKQQLLYMAKVVRTRLSIYGSMPTYKAIILKEIALLILMYNTYNNDTTKEFICID